MGAVCASSPQGPLLIGGALDATASTLCDGLGSLDEARLSNGATSQALARIAHQATTFTLPQTATLPDGTQLEVGTTLILVSGGKNGSQTVEQVGLVIAAPNQELRIYEPTDPTKKIMASPRASHSATLVQINGQTKLLLAGGFGKNGEALATTEFLDLSNFTIEPGPPLNEARAGLVAVLIPDGDVLFFGGQDQQQQSSANIDRFSPRFAEIVVEPQMLFTRRGHSATLLENGLILIAGGIGQRTSSLDAEQTLATGELFNPEDATQSGTLFTRALKEPRAGHAATLLSNGLVVLLGGTAQATNSAELYTPVPEK